MKRKNHRTAALWVLAVLAGSAMIAGSVFAKGNIRLGKLQVKPSVKYQAEYNDNVFLEHEEEKDDIVHKISPAIAMRHESSPGNYFEGGYRGEFSIYTDYKENNYQVHNPYVSAGFRTPVGFYMTFEDDFVHSTDPYGSENQYNEGVRTRRWDNTAELVLGYEFGRRFGIEGLYANRMERFDDDLDKWQDRTDHVYGGTFLYKATEKMSFLTQYRHTEAEYDEQNDGHLGWNSNNSQDYTLTDYFVGVRFKPGGKLSGEAKVGFGEKEFNNAYDVNGNPYEDTDGWVAETEVYYTPGHNTFLALMLKRSHKGSPDADAASYTDTYIGLDARQGFAERFFLDLGLGWNRNDYSEETPGLPKKYFNQYTARAGLEWRIKQWLTAGLHYKYKNKEASDGAYTDEEYENNIVTMSVGAEF